MIRTFLLTLLLLGCYTSIFSQIDQRKLSGVYQWCLVHCEAIKIDEDFTFEYIFYQVADRDRLEYKGTLKGAWKIIGNDRIQINGVDKKFKEELQSAYEDEGVSIDPAYPPDIDFIFIVKKRKLQKLFNRDVEYILVKMNKDKSKKLFPDD